MHTRRKLFVAAVWMAALTPLILAVAVLAGALDSPGAPDAPVSASYTLRDLYSRLLDGVPGTAAAFTEPAAGPTEGIMPTVAQLMQAAPAVDDAAGAAPGDVVAGKTFWGLQPGSGWGRQTGTMVVGGGATTAALPRTGQTNSYASEDDGDLRKGVVWPSPRFTDNGNGTVTDNLTGLIWIVAPHELEGNDGRQAWEAAIAYCRGLAYGGHDDWRLPNVRELHSLVDFSRAVPALPSGHPFVGIESSNYWSSTTFAYEGFSEYGWWVSLFDGYTYYANKTNNYRVWPVRAGQGG